MIILLQLASLYNGQEVSVWSDCLLDLGTDFLVGNMVGWLVSWCFKRFQPQRIISGLKETFVMRYIVERTDKAERRPEEQSEKTESCREIYGMKYS